MKVFKLRAECEHDTSLLAEKLAEKADSFAIIPYDRYPDVDMVFISSLTLDEIRDIIRTIPDSHVMLQTLQHAQLLYRRTGL